MPVRMATRATALVAGMLLASACFKDTATDPKDADDTEGETGADSTTTAPADSTGAEPGTSSSGDADDTTSNTSGEVATPWRQVFVVPPLEPGGEDGGETGGPDDPMLLDVPVLVRLTPARFNYGVASPDGSDLRFVASLDDGVALPHEIEHWEVNGTSLIWVRLPQLGGRPQGDTFWLRYGVTDVDPWSDPRDVWSSGYVGVWHFGALDDKGQFADSTAEANPMVPDGLGTNYSLDVGPGGFGSALLIEEASGLLIADDGALDLTTELSLEAWIRPSTVSMTNNHREVVDKSGAYRLVSTNLTNGRPFVNLTEPGGEPVTATAPTAARASTWTYMVGTYDGTRLRLYLDGEQVNQSAPTIGAALTTSAIQVGQRFAGRIDEVRISASHRESRWIEVQHRSALDTLLEYGPPEEL